MRLLITGGAGFIGSHLVDALLSRGDDVVVLDDFSTGRAVNLRHVANHPRLRIYEGSVTDELLVNRLMAGVDGCFHLAAAVGVNLIVEQPLRSLTTNIRGSEVVLGASANFGTKTLVTSTSEIYGKNSSDFLTEDEDRILGSPLKVRWTYSEAKAIEEALAYTLWTSQNLPTIIVRLFNTVGPRQTGHYGMVLPRFVTAALTSRPIEVYGDGRQSRVFCHVSDAVAGLLALWEEPRAHGEVFNIGGVGEVTIGDLAALVREATDSTSEITRVPYEHAYEPGFEDMQRRVPSIAKIQALTGWAPKLNLNDMIRDVVAYQLAAREV